MKLLTLTTLIACVSVITLFFYLEHENKQFTEKIQTPVFESTSPENKPATEAADTFPMEKTPVVDTQMPQKNIDAQAVDTDVHQTDHPHPHEHPHPTHAQTDDFEDSDPNGTQNDSGKDLQWESYFKKEPVVPFETLKKKLIKKHGDIPLVHTYIELRKKELNREPMTMDEVSTLWDAIMVFNPTPANKKTYQIIKHLSSQADPGSFKVYYDPEHAKQRRKTQ